MRLSEILASVVVLIFSVFEGAIWIISIPHSQILEQRKNKCLSIQILGQKIWVSFIYEGKTIVFYRIIVIMYIKRIRPVIVILDFKCNILTEIILLLLFIFRIVWTIHFTIIINVCYSECYYYKIKLLPWKQF